MAEKCNNFNNNGSLSKIKSKYILKQIFINLQYNKFLDIIKYNKKFQKIKNLTLNDYKKEHYKIVIEIIPKNNIYGKFININKNYESSYHIYINNSKEEIKKYSIDKFDIITKVKIILDQKIKSLNGLFKECNCIEKINFIKFKRKDIKNMSNIFDGCSSLKEINLSNFITENVTNMKGMFYGCWLLKEINFSNFDTKNVKDTSYMFSGCSSSKELNLTNFKTDKVNYMNYMFSGCRSLKELNIFNFVTNNVISMQ